MSAPIAYVTMDQVRQHCLVYRECPADGSVTEIFECKHCQKEFRAKLKGPGGRAKMVNQLPVKLHLMQAHNVQPAALNQDNAADFYNEMKSVIEKNQGNFSKISIKPIKNFCLAFGAKAKCYEEYLRVLRLKFGDAVARAFAAEWETRHSQFGDFDAKGETVEIAAQAEKTKVCKATIDLISKQYKIPKKYLDEFGNSSRNTRGKVSFTDPQTGLTDMIDIRVVEIGCRKFPWPFPTIFSFKWPFQSQQEDFLSPHYQGGLLKLLKNPVDCGGKIPEGYVGPKETGVILPEAEKPKKNKATAAPTLKKQKKEIVSKKKVKKATPKSEKTKAASKKSATAGKKKK